jgi:hypothetical protein
VRWHDRRNGSSSGSASRLVQTPSAQLRRNLWSGLSGESGRSREGQRRQHRDDNGRTGPVYAGLARLFRLLRNARGVDRSHSLGPAAIAGCLLALMENTKASPSSTHRAGNLGAVVQHGRSRPWTLASRPEQSPVRRTLQCLLQIARSSGPDRTALALLLEPPYTDPYVRWCGRGGAERLPLSRSLAHLRHADGSPECLFIEEHRK